MIDQFESFLEAEQSVIGGLMLDNAMLAEIDLTPADFCDGSMAEMYRAILALDSQNKPFDMETMADELRRTTGKDWWVPVATVVRITPNARNVPTYAEHVKRYRRNREARFIAQRLIESASRDDNAIDAAIADLMALNTTKRETLYSMKQALKHAVDYVDHVHKHSGELTGINTGLVDLNEVMGGYQKQDLIIVGARPAMGKTGFLLSSALEVGVPSLIQSAEMSAMQLALRAISTNGELDSQKIRTAKLEPEEWPKFSAAVGRLAEMPIWIDEASSPTIGQVQRQARKLKQTHNIQILFVDYLQRLRGNNPRDSRIDQVGEIARGLKSIARELDIPVVALAQVNRSVENRPNKRPLMGDLANSSEIEKEADEIIMLYRDEVYNEDSEDKGIAELNFEKNRHGPTGTVKTAWIPQYMRFADLALQWQNQRAHS